MPVTNQYSPQATPTRNVNAERGVGRAYRHEPNMLPRKRATVLVQKPGNPGAQGPAILKNADVLGRTGSLTVRVRSGNSDPRAIGSNQKAWSTAGIGDNAPTNYGVDANGNPNPAPPDVQDLAQVQSSHVLLIGSLAALGLFLMTRNK